MQLFLCILFLISIFFLNLNFKYVHIYTLKQQKLKKSPRGVRDSIKRPKIRRLRRKGYRKN